MRVIICDDQATVRDGLRLMLDLEPDIEVVATAQDGREALEAAAAHQPDLVLMDLSMPLMNGIEATRQIVSRFPAIRVLVLTTYDADEWLFDAIRAGAAGYLLKDTAREELIAAVRGTVAGRGFIDPAIARRVLRHVAQAGGVPNPNALREKLSERELAVLSLIAKGQANAEIAAALHLSEGTVRNYVSAILLKLEASDRTQAAIIALRHGL